MARKIDTRIIVEGKLIAQTPLHVGGLGTDIGVDLPLAVNGKGDLYVPGTSLAGALRGWMEVAISPDDAEEMWGYQKEKKSDEGIASFVIIEDGAVTLAEGASCEIRDNVGIDRCTGTAAEGIKFDRAILPRGTKIDLRMVVDIGPDSKLGESDVKSHLRALLDRLIAEDIRLGASKTRGLGRLKLEISSIKEQKLSIRDGILSILDKDKGGNEIGLEGLGKATKTIDEGLEIEIQWEPDGPLMVASGHDGMAVDTLPLVSGVNSQLSFVIPGSSIKGALRTQAERIWRTLCGGPVCDESETPNSRQRFLNQLRMPIDGNNEHNIVHWVFGAAGEENGKNNSAKSEKGVIPGLGALAIDDCYTSSVRLSYQDWSAVEQAKSDTDLRGAIQNTGIPEFTNKLQQAVHVAIDRWTGGAAEGALYSVLEPHGIEWEPIRISFNLKRIAQDKKNAALALILLLLRDLAQGRIPLGFGVNRGMGAIKVNKVLMRGPGLKMLDDMDATELVINGENLTKGDLSTIPKLNEIENSWQEIIKSPKEVRT